MKGHSHATLHVRVTFVHCVGVLLDANLEVRPVAHHNQLGCLLQILQVLYHQLLTAFLALRSPTVVLLVLTAQALALFVLAPAVLLEAPIVLIKL